MSYFDYFDRSGSASRDDRPGGNRPDHEAVTLGIWTMHVIVFLAMLGDGYPAREALAVTVALGIGCAKAIGRRPGDGDNG
jgi:hypothetical protein